MCLAQSLAQTGKTDAAVRVLDDLINSKPGPELAVRAQFMAGEVREKGGHSEEALKSYQAALALQPRPEVAAACLLRIGALQSQAKQYGPSAEALKDLQRPSGASPR